MQFNPRQNANANDLRRFRLGGQEVDPYLNYSGQYAPSNVDMMMGSYDPRLLQQSYYPTPMLPSSPPQPVMTNVAMYTPPSPSYSPAPMQSAIVPQHYMYNTADQSFNNALQAMYQQPTNALVPPGMSNGVPAYIYPIDGSTSGGHDRDKSKKKKKKKHKEKEKEKRKSYTKTKYSSRRRSGDSSSDSDSDDSRDPRRHSSKHDHSSNYPVADSGPREEIVGYEKKRVPTRKIVEEPSFKVVKQPYTYTVPVEKTRMKEVWVKKQVPEKYTVDEVKHGMRDVKVPTTVVREIDTFEEIEIPIKKIVGATTTATEMYEGPVDESSWMGSGQPGGHYEDPYRYGNGPPPQQNYSGSSGGYQPHGHNYSGPGPHGGGYPNSNQSYWTDGPNKPVQVVEEKYQKYRSSTSNPGGPVGLDTRSQASTHPSERLSARRASMPATGHSHWDDRGGQSGRPRDNNRELAPPLSARSTRFSPPAGGPTGAGEPNTEVLTHTTYQRRYDPNTAETNQEHYTNTSYRSHSPPQNDTTPRTPRNYWS